MKPLLAFTQRVVITPQGERRDALDQRWSAFAAAVGFQFVPMPNAPDEALALAQRINPDGLVLTGGNDLVAVGGDAPERDATELALVTRFERQRLPIVGVCRGAEFLAHTLGGSLGRVSGHAGTRHILRVAAGTLETNSYHDWGIVKSPEGAEAWAFAADGTVEAFRVADKRILGVMWHPERETAFSPGDISMFRSHFGISR